MEPHNRRAFIGRAALAGSAILIDPLRSLQAKPVVANKLPKWKGFNLLDFFSPDPAKARPGTEEEYFKSELVIFIRPVVMENASLDGDLSEYKKYLLEDLGQETSKHLSEQ